MKTLITFLLLTATASAADYPVLFLTAPRTSGRFQVQSISEADGPYKHHVGTDLRAFYSDGTEKLLVDGDAPGFRAVHDACMTIDGTKVYYAHIRATSPISCDLFVLDLETMQSTPLTDAANEFLPPTGYYPKTVKKGVWNVAPCETPDGIVFCSNRNSVMSPAERYPAHQLFRMDVDGKNVEKIGHLNVAGAAHPVLAPDGTVYWASAEQQGWRHALGEGWGIWSIHPDGTNWGPIISAITMPRSRSFHVCTVASNGTVFTEAYYGMHTLGTIYGAPRYSPGPFDPPTHFGDPIASKNPRVWDDRASNETSFTPNNSVQFGFQRRGFYSISPWASSKDKPNLDFDGTYLGMIGHPSATPGNGLLLTKTGTDPANTDLGIYLMPDVTKPAESPAELVKVVDQPDRHEWYGKAMVPYEAIHGAVPPKLVPKLAKELPVGSPYGVIGSSSVNWREIVNDAGAALVEFANEDVAALRVLHFNPTQDVRYAKPFENHPSGNGFTAFEGFSSAFNERTGFYETLVPIEADGSFKAIIPADDPWSVQLLNAKGEALTTAQTWHQVRPGEYRTDCHGCHAHNKPDPTEYTATIAGQPGYPGLKLTQVAYVEYERDIRAIDERLALGLGPRPHVTHPDKPKAYKSIVSTFDDDPRLTDAEARLLRSWQDTGFMAAGEYPDGVKITEAHGTGPYADTVPPTLVVRTFSDRIIIGAADAQAGLNKASFHVQSDPPLPHDEWTELDSDRWQWLGDVPDCTLTVSVRDNQRALNSDGVLVSEDGNVTRVVRTVRNPPAPPPEPDPELERLRKRNAELEAFRAAIEKALEDLP